MLPRNPAGDRQAKACPSCLGLTALPSRIAAVEALEDTRLDLRRNSGPGIRDFDDVSGSVKEFAPVLTSEVELA